MLCLSLFFSASKWLKNNFNGALKIQNVMFIYELLVIVLLCCWTLCFNCVWTLFLHLFTDEINCCGDITVYRRYDEYLPCEHAYERHPCSPRMTHETGVLSFSTPDYLLYCKKWICLDDLHVYTLPHILKLGGSDST